jgi:hypothetical protein
MVRDLADVQTGFPAGVDDLARAVVTPSVEPLGSSQCAASPKQRV